jgi:hypothetical protein
MRIIPGHPSRLIAADAATFHSSTRGRQVKNESSLFEKP